MTLKYHKNKQKNLNWSNKIWGIHEAIWTWFSRFLFPPSILCRKSSKRFPKLVRSLSANSASFFALSLWPLNAIFWSTQFHSIYNGSDSPPALLNASWFLSIFSLCVKWNIFSSLESLYVCTIVSLKGGSPLLPLKNFPFLFSKQNSKTTVCSAS